MEQEKSISESTFPQPGVSELKVIKGGKTLFSPPAESVVTLKLHNFIPKRYHDNYSLSLPLDSLASRVLKRFADLFFSTLVIVFILTWLIPVIALIIKLDSRGPVFFRQRRNKKNGREFTCMKFRTMFHLNKSAGSFNGNNKLKITRVGRFLRDHFLDEVPQFFNVWWGDMSVIGPRPHMLSDNLKYEELVDDYHFRHEVKPGITGLAQVLGYVGETTELQQMTDRVFLDNYYVRNWSLQLDIKIFLRTFYRIAGNK